MVLKGDGLSPRVRGSDPGDGANGLPVAPHPLDPNEDAAVLTARLLSVFEQRARDVLANHPVNQRRLKKGKPAANAILTRVPVPALRSVSQLRQRGSSRAMAAAPSSP